MKREEAGVAALDAECHGRGLTLSIFFSDQRDRFVGDGPYPCGLKARIVVGDLVWSRRVTDQCDFAPSLAALFESCVVEQSVTFQDRFEPRVLMAVRPQPVTAHQEQAYTSRAACERVVNVAASANKNNTQAAARPVPRHIGWLETGRLRPTLASCISAALETRPSG